MACCIFIHNYVSYQLSYDDFFTESENVFRLSLEVKSENTLEYAILPSFYLPRQTESISGIKSSTRIGTLPPLVFKTEANKNLIAENGFVADSNVFKVLNGFDILIKDQGLMLSKPGSVVLTKSIALKLFNDESSIGKRIIIAYNDEEIELVITGVLSDVPKNSHLTFDYLIDEISFQKLFDLSLNSVYTAYNYLLLEANTDEGAVANLLNNQKSVVEALENNQHFDFSYHLDPVTSIHLYSNKRAEIKSNGNIKYIRYLIVVALLIAFISSINFGALTITYNSEKDNLTGIKKISGASSISLVLEKVLESVLISFLALGISYLLSFYLSPFVNDFTNSDFPITQIFSPKNIILYLLFCISLGIVSGSFPAVNIIRNSSLNLMKGHSFGKTNNFTVHRLVLVFQVAITIVLLLCTSVAYKQIHFIQNQELGFEKKNIANISGLSGKDLTSLKKLLSTYSFVEYSSISSYAPGTKRTTGTASIEYIDQGKTYSSNWISIDEDYFDVFSIPIAEGRNFSEDYSTDINSSFIVNKAFVEMLNLDEPLGKELKAFERNGEIIGVTENFNYLSLHTSVTPLVFLINEDLHFYLAIKLFDNVSIENSLQTINNEWNSLNTNTPLSISFVEDQFEEIYSLDTATFKHFALFSMVSLLLSIFGLFGLSGFILKKRAYEIGIRKVLGATSSEIVSLLGKEFLLLSFIAIVIAIPVAYYFSNQWLLNFAYKAEIGITIYLLILISMLVLICITVSYWSLKSAFQDPVETLKS